MRVIQNDKYIKNRRRLGRYAFFAGFGILILGLILSFTSTNDPQRSLELFPVSFACLVVGLVLSQMGGYYVRRFDRGEVPFLALPKALKGFDDRYTLINYRLGASHVLLAPDAVYVLVPKAQNGKITYTNGRWRNPTGLRRLLTWMSEEGLGNPARDAAVEVARFQRFVQKNVPDDAGRAAIEAQPIVVFLHPNAEVDAGGSPVPAVHVKKLKDFLRGRPKGTLSREARESLDRILAPAAS